MGPASRLSASLGVGWDGAVPGLRVADTIKRVGSDGGVVATLKREGLVAVQTPQAFVAATLKRAFASLTPAATDCAALVEAAGGRVRVVDGDPRLVKVTTAADLELVERLLEEVR